MTVSRYRRLTIAALVFVLICLSSWVPAQAQRPQRAVVPFGDFSLSMGLVSDTVWVFEISPQKADPAAPWNLSLMTAPGTRPRVPAGSGNAWSGGSAEVQISQSPPTLTITGGKGAKLFSIGPYAPDGRLNGLSFSGDFSHLYGLGADFRLASDVFNLKGETILPGGPFGNSRLARFGYRPNQVQIPILYGLGEGLHCGALFIDETLPLMWSFNGQPWTVSAAGPLGPEGTFRFFVFTGPDMPALRQDFMALTGRPPVPPEKILGVWATGVRGNTETDWLDKVNTLKNVVPGLAGLSVAQADDPAKLGEIVRPQGLALMLDESAYVPQTDPLYPEMARRSFLVRQNGPGGPVMVLNRDGVKSGLVDYTNNSASTFWHSLFREQQIASGLTAFRLVDGDLDDFSPNAWYEGSPDSAIHSHYGWANSYAFKWLEGIGAGLRNQRLRSRPRLMLLSRTAVAGLPRLAGALYNGESFLFTGRSLVAVKAHVALSGLDYYSSDLSHTLSSRPAAQFGSSYDAWLAKSALTDFPLLLPEDLLLRPSSRYNLALRESLSPYCYSLAWEAYQNGRPLLAPLAYYFQDDLAARNRISEMMLGPNLLMGLDLDGTAERTNMYVPEGLWYDWRTGEVLEQKEGGLVAADLKDAGQVTPPLLARGGSIIPAVEEMPLKGGLIEKIPALKIFIGQAASEFTWYEDDGESQNYLSGRFGKTLITAVTNPDGSTVVTIKAREGSWEGAPAERRLLVDIYGPKAPGEATLDSLPYNRVARASDLEPLESGWASFGNNRIRFKTPPLDMGVDHVLWFK